MSRQPDYNSQYNYQYSQPPYGHFDRTETSTSRNWSEEAVRGSWESSYQRSMAASPGDANSSASRAAVPRAEHEARATMVDSWIGQQRTHDPRGLVDAVSDFATPESSPCISDGSSTFQPTAARGSYPHQYPHGQHQYHHQHNPSSSSSAAAAAYGTPTSYAAAGRGRGTTPAEYSYHYTTSSPGRAYGYRPSPPEHYASSTRDGAAPANYSSDYDLRGVGSFTDPERPRFVVSNPSYDCNSLTQYSRASNDRVKYKPLTNWFDMWLP